MTTKELLQSIAPGIGDILNAIDPDSIDELVDAIIESNRVFTAGWGRAGNIVRILGMDLSQFGKQVYCVGDNSTPSIHRGDILIVNSGSGNTKTISIIAEQAKSFGAIVALITGSSHPKESLIGKISDHIIRIPDRFDMPDIWDMEPEIIDEEASGEGNNKGLGLKIRYNITPEQREQMTMDKYFSVYEVGFILNEVIMQKYMEKTGHVFEDINYYHNNLE
ncbi:MAG: SIS domain-containing protein [Clostridia bacterium]|nr:SIS domain-containing protein [Clostridia bacterium]